jgi:hypothetical protein
MGRPNLLSTNCCSGAGNVLTLLIGWMTCCRISPWYMACGTTHGAGTERVILDVWRSGHDSAVAGLPSDRGAGTQKYEMAVDRATSSLSHATLVAHSAPDLVAPFVVRRHASRELVLVAVLLHLPFCSRLAHRRTPKSAQHLELLLRREPGVVVDAEGMEGGGWSMLPRPLRRLRSDGRAGHYTGALPAGHDHFHRSTAANVAPLCRAATSRVIRSEPTFATVSLPVRLPDRRSDACGVVALSRRQASA